MNVLSKKVVGKRTVYDLSVKNNHNYEVTKSNIKVHNSGKGFVKDKLLGVEGWNFDVDELKTMAMKAPKISQKVKDEFGVDMSKLVLKNPDDVSKLHDIIGGELKLDKKKQFTLYDSILSSHADRKPNLIFDVTLKDLRKLDNISRNVNSIGYDKSNIHIVWIVQDIEVAKKLNLKRDRTVHTEILVNTHRGASATLNDIIEMGSGLKKYMNGDIVLAFNKVDIDKEIYDTEFEFSTDDEGKKKKTRFSGKDVGYIKDADYVYIKRKGKPVTPLKQIDKTIKAKIAKYVPKGVTWD